MKQSSLSALTLIQPRRSLIRCIVQAFTLNAGVPDLLDGPTLDEVVDGHVDVRDSKGPYNGPYQSTMVLLMLRNEAEEEDCDGDSDSVKSEKVRRLSDPEEHESARLLISRHVLNMPTKA